MKQRLKHTHFFAHVQFCFAHFHPILLHGKLHTYTYIHKRVTTKPNRNYYLAFLLREHTAWPNMHTILYTFSHLLLHLVLLLVLLLRLLLLVSLSADLFVCVSDSLCGGGGDAQKKTVPAPCTSSVLK